METISKENGKRNMPSFSDSHGYERSEVKQTRELEERAAQQARFMQKSLEETERRAAERETEMKNVLQQKERAEAERLKVRLLFFISMKYESKKTLIILRRGLDPPPEAELD
eukprot:1187333-Prorocentrum_minimum.AAC.1